VWSPILLQCRPLRSCQAGSRAPVTHPVAPGLAVMLRPVNGSAPVPEDAPDNLRLGICQGLMRWSFENVERWTADRSLESADLIIVTIFARSGRTYEAVVRWLGERAFGEQGLMLNRSLFEDMIDAHWVSLNRDLAVQRLAQHDLYSRLLRSDTQRRFPDHFDGPPPKIKVTNEERKALRQLYGKSGSRSWTGVDGLVERVEAVKGCWRTEDEQTTLLWWTAWVHKLTNEVLHPSAFSIGRLGSPTVGDDGGFEWHFGSTREWLEQALHGAFFTFGQLAGLMIEEYAPEDAQALRERMESGHDAFARAKRWEETGVFDESPDDGGSEATST
jgi:hypothetical protein